MSRSKPERGIGDELQARFCRGRGANVRLQARFAETRLDRPWRSDQECVRARASVGGCDHDHRFAGPCGQSRVSGFQESIERIHVQERQVGRQVQHSAGTATHGSVSPSREGRIQAGWLLLVQG